MSAPSRFPPIDPRHPHLLHGGDYNPDQWLHAPEIIDEDFRLVHAAHVNTFTVGVFAWSALEPEEGKYQFDWLDRILDRMAERKMAAVLATPSGARPAWLSFKYPEVNRVTREGRRLRHGGRHNHCFTSPVYRENVHAIDSKLAQRYAKHPALSVWHLSNEYNGDCHCNLCYAAFRAWLRRRYNDSLDQLNRAWWSSFWSHSFTSWDQIEPQDDWFDGLKLDWKRFVTDQTIDFMKHELAAIRQFSKDIPATTNMMGIFEGLDYWKIAKEIDVISWDAYPLFHEREDIPKLAAQQGMIHDMYRSMKGGRPFILMESTPSVTNWSSVCQLKPPGLHKLMSLQAVAHGSDTVQYFQWRKNRGSMEKFHGAVVDHVGHENTRVFQEVADVGRMLENLSPIVGTRVAARVAIIVDWQNRWALEGASGPRQDKQYLATCEDHHRALWSMGVPTDVIDSDQPLDRYRIVIAPMLYMIRPGVADRIDAFFRGGGAFIATHMSGIVDENDLNFLGGWPGPLRQVLGIWSEETDALYDDERRKIVAADGNDVGLRGSYEGRTLCDLIQADGAKVLATYGDGFYEGRPVLTVNRFGAGEAFYLTTRADDRFLRDFYGSLVKRHAIARAIDVELPPGVSAQARVAGDERFVFLMNFTRADTSVKLPAGGSFSDLLTSEDVGKSVALEPYGVRVLRANGG